MRRRRSPSGPVTLVEGIGTVRHPVSTRNRVAQRYFDQGLRYVYAFNHAEAVRSFTRAAELDPDLAMAYWGIALALGPNINANMTPEQVEQANAAIERARHLADGASDAERAYIRALSVRYSTAKDANRQKLDAAYSAAMRQLMRRYPRDVDAAVLYAESAMDLRPWKLYTADGRPEPGTEEIVAVLESALRRAPNHTGANHYYIHAVEASRTPERALAAAHRLERLAPRAGHLAHMPAHVYIRLGDYDGAARANRAGMEADAAYMKAGGQGMYSIMYGAHNMHFLAIGEAIAGRYTSARRAADALSRHLAPVAKEIPDVDPFLATRLLIDVRFERWDEVLAAPEPPFEQPQSGALWHFGRGMALARTDDQEGAARELAALREAMRTMPQGTAWGNNATRDVLGVAEAELVAAIARARGDRAGEVTALQRAVVAADALAYDEPPAWYLFPRESLGGALLRQGDANGRGSRVPRRPRAQSQQRPLAVRPGRCAARAGARQGSPYRAGRVHARVARRRHLARCRESLRSRCGVVLHSSLR